MPRDQRRQRQVTPVLVMGGFHVVQHLLDEHVGERTPGTRGLLGLTARVVHGHY